MKRRNGDLPKLRRPVKKNKITDGIYGSSVVYLKFFILWALVLLADFLLEFRFEFLWPFWLLLRSVYDSYKYQGLAFSVFFVSIALTSDMICYFFIPVQWLFFAASTYVWVQYVWHTEKGICWPTVLLWVGFAYMEAAVRLKDLRHMPFHLDLCRPFAAHCIGYPVVTLGFGFKSYVSFRIRQRRQREVRKENGFYMNLLSQALPIEALQSDPAVSPDKSKGESNGVGYHGPTSAHGSGKSGGHRKSMDKGQVVEPYTNGSVHQDFELSDKSKLNGTAVKTKQNSSSSSLVSPFRMLCFRSSRVVSPELEEEESPVNTSSDLTNSTSNDSKEGATSINSTVGPGGDKVRNATKGRNSGGARGGQSSLSLKKNRLNRDVQSTPAAPLQSPSDPAQEYCQRLESDVKRFKSEITQLRQSESDLKSQLSSAGTSEKSVRAELATLRHHHDDIQTKLQNLMTCRTADQKSISSLEKRLNEEKRLRSCAESALAQERKANKQAQQQHHQQQQLQQQQQQLHVQKASLAVGGPTWGLSSPHMDRNCLPVGECCNDCCRQRRRDLENEIKNLRRDLKAKEGKCATADREIQNLIQYKENQPGAEVLMKALNILQDKNSHLENSLSAETRIKLDLFSALGDAKRHLEIRDRYPREYGMRHWLKHCSPAFIDVIRSKDHEIEELKTKLAQVLAVMPAASEFLSVTSQQHPLLSNSPVSLSNSLAMSASGLGGGGGGGRLPKLRPMPMASDQSPSSSSSSSSSLVISPVTPSLLLRTSSPQQIQQQTSSSIMVTSPSSILAPNHHHHHQNGSTGPSNLDPNAGVYTPKPSRLVSEA